MDDKQQARYNKLEGYRQRYEAMVATCPDYWYFCALQAADLTNQMIDVKTQRKPLSEAVRLVVR